MAAKKVKKSNVRQDDPYDNRARNAKAITENAKMMAEYAKTYKDWYHVEVARSEDLVMFEERKKSTGGAAGRTITTPSFLRSDAEKRTGPRTTKKSSKK